MNIFGTSEEFSTIDRFCEKNDDIISTLFTLTLL